MHRALRPIRNWLGARVRRRVFPAWDACVDAAWAVRRRGRPLTIRHGGGAGFRMHAEGNIARMLWATDFELREREFLHAYLQPGMRVANVGANAGLYTLLAAERVRESGRVYAFE